ncbi:TPA: helix-hairpin-helix domain-containing protein [Streptococcus pyogenes]|uniref:helix-hairpin-helix domain-containing protein n=1 Tax=Streptococcus pyogenes TaxID=1314 RepID=UPI0010A0D7DB|nr:helix-hairpin-helix domain-containing protein [Streptococcus pyogenes]VHF31819.1 ComE operon protein 1 [Streptococcus pyogenes]HER6475236.1 helix-hairpin-helix domain-containing protein [Streptococcus pyogenes]HER6476687.1 helix-hairpin-helix domain-containing protein [Streptococcus pyogenes]HER6476979.1 helix-hairpin-helix domain-containing protein [Streptococcus pyogenes]HER6481029.1 helix-hairpin-helix domain-containing protein [Streptococcus pyogenes]
MIDDLLTKVTNSLKKVYSLPRLIGVVLAIFLILTLSFVIWGKEQSQTKLPIVSTSSSIQQPVSEEKKYSSEESNILVDLKGAVQQEGVYKLRANSRVRDVIELAGGLTQEADRHAVNFAEKLVDEQVVYVAKQGEDISVLPNASSAGKANAEMSNSTKVNINKANLEELQRISGIGVKRAQDILETRDSLGGFKTLDDLRQVSGIGEKTLEKLKHELSLD